MSEFTGKWKALQHLMWIPAGYILEGEIVECDREFLNGDLGIKGENLTFKVTMKKEEFKKKFERVNRR